MSLVWNRVIAWIKSNVVPITIATAPLILIGFPLIQGNVLIWGTPSLQFIPWWAEACRQLAQGHLPLWNSLSGMGAPLLANYQSAFFYPPNWLLVPLGFLAQAPGIAIGFTFLAMAHLIWAGWGIAAILRRSGANELAQMIGGLSFALCGYWVARLGFFSIVWAGAWFPWIVYFSSMLASPINSFQPIQKFQFSVPLALSIGMLLLAGHAQISWYVLLFTFIWVGIGSLRHVSPSSVWPVFSLAAAGLAGCCVASIQIFPTAEYLMLSQRSAEYGYLEAMTYSFWPWRFVTLAAPDFFGNPGLGNYWGYASYWEDAIYIGILPLILALSTLAGVWHRSKTGEWSGRYLKVTLWIVILISFVLSLGSNTPVFPFLYRYIPTFDMFQAPARYMIWAVFSLSILAGVGADSWRCPSGRGLYWLRLGTAGAFAVTLGAGLAWMNLRGVNMTFIRATALAGFWGLGAGILTLLMPYFFRLNKRSIWNCLVVGWVMIDLLVANWWLNPFVDSSFYAGSEPSVAELKEELAGRRAYMSVRMESILKFRTFFRATDYRPVDEWQNLRATLLPNLNLLDDVAMVNNFDPLVPARYARWVGDVEFLPTLEKESWLSLAGVGAITRIDPAQPGGVRFNQIESLGLYPIYSCPDWVVGEENALANYALAAKNPNRIILELRQINQPQSSCPHDILDWAKPIDRQPGKIIFSSSLSSSGYVFVDESWYPGWRATVDGIGVDIYRANYLFMAIFAPAGDHEIRLEYRPISFAIGAMLSILMLIFFLYLAHRYKKLTRPGEEAATDIIRRI